MSYPDSEGEAYTKRLGEAGSAVKATNCYTNVTHKFFGLGAVVKEGDIEEWLVNCRSYPPMSR